MGQSVGCLTSAQVMISQSMGLSPSLGSVLIAQSLEPALDSGSPSVSAPPLLTLSLKNEYMLKIKKKTKKLLQLDNKKTTQLGHLGGSVS